MTSIVQSSSPLHPTGNYHLSYKFIVFFLLFFYSFYHYLSIMSLRSFRVIRNILKWFLFFINVFFCLFSIYFSFNVVLSLTLGRNQVHRYLTAIIGQEGGLHGKVSLFQIYPHPESISILVSPTCQFEISRSSYIFTCVIPTFIVGVA